MYYQEHGEKGAVGQAISLQIISKKKQSGNNKNISGLRGYIYYCKIIHIVFKLYTAYRLLLICNIESCYVSPLIVRRTIVTVNGLWRLLQITVITLFLGLPAVGGAWGVVSGGSGVYQLERAWPPQFKAPLGTVADGSGHIYATDSGNHRIQKLDAVTGAVLTIWGSDGSGQGEFATPWGVAVDVVGNVYVTDRGNSSVQKFTAEGRYLLSFGVAGSADGEFQSPTGIAVDGSGSIYVADQDNSRIQKFAPDGTHLLSWGRAGSGHGEFNYPQQLAVAEGIVYVADRRNHRIQKFNAADGAFVGIVGYGNGSGVGQLSYPVGVAVDRGGNVYVADYGNDRIQKFDAAGNWLYRSDSNDPTGVSVDSGGHLYVTDYSDGAVRKLAASDGTFLNVWGGGNDNPGQLNNPSLAAVDGAGNLYVADGDNDRVQKFSPNGAYLSSFGAGSGNDAGEFSHPSGVAVDGSGNVYVSDYNNNRIQKFRANGAFVTAWGGLGGGNGQFSGPMGIALDGSGYLYVTDYGNGRVQKFTTSGVFQGLLGDGVLSGPQGIAVDGGGALYVTEQNTHRIVKLAPSGAVSAFWGGPGSGEGEFQYPQGIALDAAGNVYVADYANHRIQKFDSVGRFLYAWGSYGSGLTPGAAQFSYPSGVTVDGGGTLFAVDQGNNRVQKFNPRSDLVPFVVSTCPPGVPVTVDGISYAASQDFNWEPGSSHLLTSAAIVGSSDTRYLFDNWSDAGERSHAVTAPSAAATYIATFATQYQLTTDIYDGKGSITPATGNWYYEGTSVPLSALADPGYRFYQWGGTVVVPRSDATTVIMGGAQSVGAYFTKIETVSVTLQSSPPGLGMVVDGTTLTAPQSFDWAPGSSHTVATTSPQGSTGGLRTTFATWSDGGAMSHTVTVPLSGPVTYTAFFTVVSGDNYLLERAWPPQFDGPAGMAADAAGHVYVTDSVSNSLKKIDATSGVLLALWGGSGGGVGQFNSPSGVALDGDGNLYVADTGNNRVQKFTADGEFLLAFGSSGSNGGEFSGPLGIAVDGGGMVYVTDNGNNRIQKFAADGTFLALFGAPGSGDGQLSDPRQLAVRGGILYVADYGNHRIRKFNSADGSFLGSIGSDSGNGGLYSPTGIAVDGSGHLYVTDSYTNRIKQFNASGNWVDSSGGYGSGDGRFDSPSGIAVDGAGYLYIADSSNGRVQKLTAADGTFVASWGLYGSSSGQLSYPYNAALDRGGNVYVTDYNNHRLQKFDAAGTYIYSWGGYGDDEGDFDNPAGVVVDGSGNVYVADQDNHRIQKFTSSGKFILSWGDYGDDAGDFDAPAGIALDGGGNVYVADQGNHRIQKFSSSGKFLLAWGSSGSGAGEFHSPAGIALDSGGNVYVADFGNQRIQKFSSSGRFLLSWGSSGSDPGEFSGPAGVTVDGGGHVYVVDQGNHRIQKFDSSGNLLTLWGSEGSGLANGAAQFSSPTGVTVDSSGNVYVVDSANNRIQKFDRRSDLAPVTVQSSPSGLTVFIDGVPYTTPQTFSWREGSRHTMDTPTPQTPLADIRYSFDSWTDGGAVSHSINVPSGAATYSANFMTEYQLYTCVSVGSGIVTPPDGNWYPPGAVVPLRAIPDPGYQFDYWIYGPVADPYAAETTVTMDQRMSAYAVFRQLVTIQSDPPGRTVMVDGASYTAPHTFAWDPWSDHYVGASSPQSGAPGSRYLFDSWSDGGAATHYIHIDPAFPAYTARFKLQYTAENLPIRLAGGGAPYSCVAEAYTVAAGIDTILARDGLLPEGVIHLNLPKTITFKGGYGERFAARSAGTTTIKGAVIVEKGVLVVDGMTIL